MGKCVDQVYFVEKWRKRQELKFLQFFKIFKKLTMFQYNF